MFKIIMDNIFGMENFRNEIVWCYKGGNATKIFRRKHDIILFYSKSDTWIFNDNATRIPYSEKLLESTKIDKDGKRYYLTGQNKEGKVYINPFGQLLYDWWDDIPSATMSHGKEYTGYPTQKPLDLLKRIIKASSNNQSVVYDKIDKNDRRHKKQ